MDLETLTVDQHETEIRSLGGKVRELRAQQLAHHDAAEAKRKLIPVVATANDITFSPSAVSNEALMLEAAKKLPGVFISFIKNMKWDQ